MSRDEHGTPRHDQGTAGRRPEPGGWEEQAGAPPGWEKKAGAPPGWERRYERKDRLREGTQHPLHHGRTLHGDHAFDGADRHEVDEAPPRSEPKP